MGIGWESGNYTRFDLLVRAYDLQVSFDNPRWHTWLSKVVGEVYLTLGVNVAASVPRCDLYKLLLCETGSQ